MAGMPQIAIDELSLRADMTPRGRVLADHAAADRVISQGARFAVAKFLPPALPGTLVVRPVLQDRLMTGAGQRLTVVVGSAGSGKSVLLSSWVAARPPGATCWLSCDEADANPVRFWAGFIEAARVVEPGFGADAGGLLTMDGAVTADVTASIANDAAKLPAGSAIVVDDFHYAAVAVSGGMADLVERWPAEAVQLVLASSVDPPLRLHRLRMSSQLCELRDRDLYFSLAETRDLLTNFGVQIGAGDLAQLHQSSEGWAAALQMAALSLRGTSDAVRAARALDVRGTAIGEYFVSEVLDRQPVHVARFMLDVSVLGDLTEEACAAVTGRADALALLRGIDGAHLFLTALDEQRTRFRYHQLVRHVLRGELRARDRAREQALQLRAAEWFEAANDTRRAARHFLAARQADRALELLQGGVVAEYLRDPALPPPPDLSRVDPSVLAKAPDRLLALAADLLLSGDLARAGQYLDRLEHAGIPAEPESELAARLAGTQALRYSATGQAYQAVREALAARAIIERTQLSDEWTAAFVSKALLRADTWLEDYEAVEREPAVALAAPELSQPVKLVLVPGARAAAWMESGRLAQAAQTARTAQEHAQRLGFDQHFFALDYRRVLAGLALERRDLDAAEQLTEQALSISERGWPAFEFLALLDRAAIWAARGQVRDALAAIEAARPVLAGTGSVLLTRADELEAVLRLTLGDARTPAQLAAALPAPRRALLQAKIALAADDHHAAHQHLHALPSGTLTPRQALVRQLLLTAAAISRGDPAAASLLAATLPAARRDNYCHTVVTAAPQLTTYLIEQSHSTRQDSYIDQLVIAAQRARAAQPGTGSVTLPAGPLTRAELRVMQLLPTSTYPQIAAALYISRATVKTHLRSIYHKLGVASRTQAIERAIDLRLL